jgi:hypothetical protein
MRLSWITLLLCCLFFPLTTFSAPLPSSIPAPGEKLVLVNPRTHAWGAYSSNGNLVHWGLASAGANWCSDIQRTCHTQVGSFRIYALGDEDCYSTRFPIPTGGAPMPYCMYFNGNQALHGSLNVVHGNISHGCVRMRPSDAQWLRYNFVEGPDEYNGQRGTLVVILPY